MPLWLERNSLQNLSQCAQHPIISRYVKQLDISCHQFSPDVWEAEPHPCRVAIPGYDAALLPSKIEEVRACADGTGIWVPKDDWSAEDHVAFVNSCKDAVARLDYQRQVEDKSWVASILTSAFEQLSNIKSGRSD